VRKGSTPNKPIFSYHKRNIYSATVKPRNINRSPIIIDSTALLDSLRSSSAGQRPTSPQAANSRWVATGRV